MPSSFTDTTALRVGCGSSCLHWRRSAPSVSTSSACTKGGLGTILAVFEPELKACLDDMDSWPSKESTTRLKALLHNANFTTNASSQNHLEKVITLCDHEPFDVISPKPTYRELASKSRRGKDYAGTDFIVARNGRIASVYLFFDELP